jgi:hypothetical protein
MQDQFDQLLVKPGHADQITGVLGVRTQECSPDCRFAMNTDQRLPNTLVVQRRVRLGWDRCGSMGRACFEMSRRNDRDAAGEAPANLGWVGLVLDLFQTADHPTQPIEPGPLRQPSGRRIGARSRQGITDRPSRPQQQDDHHRARPAHPEATPNRTRPSMARRSVKPVEVFDLFVAWCSQLHALHVRSSPGRTEQVTLTTQDDLGGDSRVRVSRVPPVRHQDAS